MANGSSTVGSKKWKGHSAWNPHYEPLIKELLSNSSIKLRSGIEVGHKTVDYFKGQDFVKWILKNQDDLSAKFPEHFNSSSTDKIDTESIIELGDKLIQNRFIYRVESVDITGAISLPSEAAAKSKRPIRLACSPTQSFDTSSLYVLAYEHATSWNYLLLSLIMIAVIAICMFPAWPLYMRLLMWYFLVFITTVLMVLIILRLIFFVALWYCGYDFWFLPNFFDDQLGVIDSFKPVYSIIHRNDSWGMVGVRIFLAILTACSIVQLGKQHSLEDIGSFAKRQFLDVVDWGHQKLAASPADMPDNSHQGNIAYEATELNETLMYECMRPCGFESFDSIKEDCLYDCTCMNALVDSLCYSKCPFNTRKVFDEALQEACWQESKEKDEST